MEDIDFYDSVIKECLRRNFTNQDTLLDQVDTDKFLIYAESVLLPDDYTLIENKVLKYLEL